MNPLQDLIRAEIGATGPIPFARFMELSLYCPEYGYYERIGNIIGRCGDFFTSASVGRLFGELLAFQFAQWLDRIADSPRHPATTNDRFHCVRLLEAGAHDGRLAEDILGWIETRRAPLFENLEYWILEPSGRRRDAQRKTLRGHLSKVRWYDSWQALPAPGFCGVMFSNELLDAFPVHRLGWDAGTRNWFEWGVGLQRDKFVWIHLPKLSPGVETHLLENGPDPRCRGSHHPMPRGLAEVLPDDFTIEVCPAAVDWWRRAAGVLRRGRLLTFDYGLSAEEFLLPRRARGTLRAFYRHQWNDDVLLRTGLQDLTSHVDFTALRSAGESAGLKTGGFDTQTAFLTRIAEATWKDPPAFGEWDSSRVRQFQTLTHPEHMGRAFRVLVQKR